MLAIGVYIHKVVYDIDCTRNETEQPKASQRPQEVRQVEQFAIKNQRSEEKEILRPLAGAHGFDQEAQHGFILPAIWDFDLESRHGSYCKEYP
jgi:hypothetical protein